MSVLWNNAKKQSRDLTNAMSPCDIKKATTMSLFAELKHKVISKSQGRIDALAVL